MVRGKSDLVLMDLDALTRRGEGLGSWRTGKPASTEK